MLEIGGAGGHSFATPLGLLGDCHRRIELFHGRMRLVVTRFQGGELPETARTAVTGCLHYFGEAAHWHTADEEDSLFPRLRASRDPAATAILARLDDLSQEHGVMDDSQAAIRRLFQQWLEQDALNQDDLHDLDGGLIRLQGLYDSHIAFEDRQLFPLAAAVLDADALAAIGQEMASRRGLSC